jgi:ligand-binding sensor domain-containing protein
MSRSWIKFLAQVIFAFFVTIGDLFALDPSKAVTQYQLDVWTERNGLPQGSVQAITQTRDGYLWIATRDGLARFDGVTFTTFRSENSPGLPSNDIRALEEDRQGRLWIGTFNAGLSCYSNGRFRAYSKKDGCQAMVCLRFSRTAKDRCGCRRGAGWPGTTDEASRGMGVAKDSRDEQAWHFVKMGKAAYVWRVTAC